MLHSMERQMGTTSLAVAATHCVNAAKHWGNHRHRRNPLSIAILVPLFVTVQTLLMFCWPCTVIYPYSKKPTGCTIYFQFISIVNLYMFLIVWVQTLFCTMTNKCTIISQIITLLHVSTLSCHPQGACNQYLAKLHKYFKRSCWKYILM